MWVERWTAWRWEVLSVSITPPSWAVLLCCSNIGDPPFNAPVLLLCRDRFGSAFLTLALIRVRGMSQRCFPPICLQVNMNAHTHSSEQNTPTQQQAPSESLSAHVLAQFCRLSRLSPSPQLKVMVCPLLFLSHSSCHCVLLFSLLLFSSSLSFFSGPNTSAHKPKHMCLQLSLYDCVHVSV